MRVDVNRNQVGAIEVAIDQLVILTHGRAFGKTLAEFGAGMNARGEERVDRQHNDRQHDDQRPMLLIERRQTRRAAREETRPGRWPFATCASAHRSEEHTSELQSLMRISYAVF